MSPKKNHFEFLGLPERFELDTSRLQQVYLRLQAAVHPDRYANAGATEHRIAMQLATQVNEAYRTLLDPGRRAAYLCELRGAPIRAETNTAMAREFLMQQMQWREALEEAPPCATMWATSCFMPHKDRPGRPQRHSHRAWEGYVSG